MDSVQSLIHKLYLANSRGEDNMVLLAIIRDLEKLLAGPQTYEQVAPVKSETVSQVNRSFTAPKPPRVVSVEADAETVLSTSTSPANQPFSYQAPSADTAQKAKQPETAKTDSAASPYPDALLEIAPELWQRSAPVTTPGQAAVPAEPARTAQPSESGAVIALNEKLARPVRDLNEKFSSHQPMVAEVLARPPLSDLQLAFSVNDRFLLVQELFRGNSQMFDQAIQQLNQLNDPSEAINWISRHLAGPLGWSRTDEKVAYFFELVSRRFS